MQKEAFLNAFLTPTYFFSSTVGFISCSLFIPLHDDERLPSWFAWWAHERHAVMVTLLFLHIKMKTRPSPEAPLAEALRATTQIRWRSNCSHPYISRSPLSRDQTDSDVNAVPCHFLSSLNIFSEGGLLWSWDVRLKQCFLWRSPLLFKVPFEQGSRHWTDVSSAVEDCIFIFFLFLSKFRRCEMGPLLTCLLLMKLIYI